MLCLVARQVCVKACKVKVWSAGGRGGTSADVRVRKAGELSSSSVFVAGEEFENDKTQDAGLINALGKIE